MFKGKADSAGSTAQPESKYFSHSTISLLLILFLDYQARSPSPSRLVTPPPATRIRTPSKPLAVSGPEHRLTYSMHRSVMDKAKNALGANTNSHPQ